MRKFSGQTGTTTLEYGLIAALVAIAAPTAYDRARTYADHLAARITSTTPAVDGATDAVRSHDGSDRLLAVDKNGNSTDVTQ